MCGFLFGELGNGEVNEIVCGVDAIVDVIPQLVPEHRAGKRILNFVEVKLERSECVVIESYFSVSMISMVNLISFDRSTNVYLNVVEFLGITENNVFHDVFVEFVIIESNVKLLLS